MGISLIAFDLDDTLLDDRLQISGRTIRAIERARAKGIRIVPASGRCLPSMLNHITGKYGFDAVIALNGASVYDEHLKPLMVTAFPREIGLEVVDFARERGVYVHSYDDRGFFCERDCEESRHYVLSSGIPPRYVGDLKAGLLPLIPKMLFICFDIERMAGIREELRARFSDRLNVTLSKPIYTELMHPQASKGLALAEVCKRFGVPASEVLALGDGANDLPMLRFAGTGLLMANALPEVRAAFPHLAGSNNEDGVAKAIEEFAL